MGEELRKSLETQNQQLLHRTEGEKQQLREELEAQLQSMRVMHDAQIAARIKERAEASDERRATLEYTWRTRLDQS